MKNYFLFLFSLYSILCTQYSFSQDSASKEIIPQKFFKAVRTTAPPKIDGSLDDEVWKNAEKISDFIQNTPYEGKSPTQWTEVKILYDNFAIYVGAMMYDTSPDSIYHELGNRDDGDLNAEKFRFVVDPYNKRHDAYDFGVYSSGVQLDSRFSDFTYNGVWQSAVKILNNGWSVEMKIPYSAIRFPNTKEQQWAAQFTRDIRRNREFDQWSLTPNGQSNPQKYWGTIIGISDIRPPLRLSLSPYLSSYYSSQPAYNADGTYSYSKGFSNNYGADIKYGLDERFTLDMTLLPDFGQVQSDNKIKNLSYREVTYNEYRPFFTEGTDLFQRSGLFYSRRIGKTPTYFSSIIDSLKNNETILKNPSQAKLLNATKISGRTNSGLGIGFLNAITDNTYAVIKNDSSGETRKILTEPLTNYNVLVLDQHLKNASGAYLINTNVTREGKNYRDANVTAAGFNLQDKKNKYELTGGYSLSQQLTKGNYPHGVKDSTGSYFYESIGKISGTWQYLLRHEAMTPSFSRSDMGYFAVVNYSSFNGNLSYNIFKPVNKLLRSFNNWNVHYAYNYTNGLPTDLSTNLNLFFLYNNFFSMFGGGGASPMSSFDYYEPRVAGKFFRTAQWWYTYYGISTDYRKPFAIDFNVNTGNFLPNIHGFPLLEGYGFEIKPRFRASDKLSFIYDFNYNFDPFNPGFATFDSVGNPIFGARKLNTFINTFTSRYIFKNNLSFSINVRHYWNTGKYLHYYNLLPDGMLSEISNYGNSSDFSYNAFNVDAVFSWQFAPGSLLTIVYKNAIEKNDAIIPHNFTDNFSYTLQSPQTNSISLKVLCYLDYQYLKRRSARS